MTRNEILSVENATNWLVLQTGGHANGASNHSSRLNRHCTLKVIVMLSTGTVFFIRSVRILQYQVSLTSQLPDNQLKKIAVCVAPKSQTLALRTPFELELCSRLASLGFERAAQIDLYSELDFEERLQ